MRGERQYLYDDKGVRYLDTMNSVQLGKAGGGGEGGGGGGGGPRALTQAELLL